MHKSLQIWGWFLPKKIDLPTQGGGRNGNFRGSKNQKSGKCHELSRKSIKFVFTHPTRGGGGVRGGGSKFQKSGKFHELSRKSINKIFYPPPPTTTGSRSGNFRESKNQKSGKCHELPRKSIHFFYPSHPGGVRGGWVGDQNFKSPVNFMNCRENR